MKSDIEIARECRPPPPAALAILLPTTQRWRSYALFLFATLLLLSAERKKSVSSLPE